MKNFTVYFENEDNLYKALVPAESKKSVKQVATELGHIGEIVSIKEIEKTMCYAAEVVETALADGGFDKAAIELITAVLKLAKVVE